MSSMEELRQRISVINSRVGQINDQRNKNIGMRESLVAQINQGVTDYKAKYGVDISSNELVEAEFKRVSAEKEESVNLLENVIAKIEAGDYTGANALLGLETSSTATASEPAVTKQAAPQGVFEAGGLSATPTPTAGEPSVAPVASACQPVVTPMAGEPSVAPVASAGQPVVSEPVATPTPVPLAPTMPSTPVKPDPVGTLTGAESFLEGFEKPAEHPSNVTPPPAPSVGVGQSSTTQPKPVNPISFDGILSGTQFQV